MVLKVLPVPPNCTKITSKETELGANCPICLLSSCAKSHSAFSFLPQSTRDDQSADGSELLRVSSGPLCPQ